jgi:hypothetical protein
MRDAEQRRSTAQVTVPQQESGEKCGLEDRGMRWRAVPPRLTHFRLPLLTRLSAACVTPLGLILNQTTEMAKPSS